MKLSSMFFIFALSISVALEAVRDLDDQQTANAAQDEKGGFFSKLFQGKKASSEIKTAPKDDGEAKPLPIIEDTDGPMKVAILMPTGNASLSKSSSTSSERSSKSVSWSSSTISITPWPSYNSETSEHSSSSSSSSTSSQTSESLSKHNEKTAVKDDNPEPHRQYDYMNDAFIKHVIANNFRYVLVGSGWSETSMGKMNLNNQEKQKRAFAMSYAQILKIDQLGGLGQLIYLTTSPINPYYRRYIYHIANKPRMSKMTEKDIESHFRNFEKHSLRLVYFSARERERNATNITGYLSEKSNRYRQILLPKSLNALRNDFFVSNHFVGFTAHFSGEFLEKLAKKWDLPYLVNPSAQAHWIKKSRSRQSFRNAGVRHPRGTYEPAFSVDALVDDINDLLSKLSYKKIILKLDQSAAGYGNKVMKFDEINAKMDDVTIKAIIRKRFEDKEIFPDFFIRRIEDKDGGAIVEEYIDCKNYASPASIYMINGLHDVNMRYTYDQLLGGKDNQVFQGSLGPITVDQSYAAGDLIAMSRAVGMSLSEEGVRGNVGTDFVTCDSDDGTHRDAWAIENNVRMTGTSYPYYLLETLVGSDVIATKFMKSFDDVKIPVIAFRDFRSTIQRDFYMSFLRNHADTINVATARGCIVHNDTFRLGRIGVACLADSRKEVSDLYDRFAASLYKFIDDHESTYEYRKFVKLLPYERLKVSMQDVQKTVGMLLGQDVMLKKQIDVQYDTVWQPDNDDSDSEQTSRTLKPVMLNRQVQQDFFTDYLVKHPAYFNLQTGTGCLINNDIFKIKNVGMLCIWDHGPKPANYDKFYRDIQDQLFVNDNDDLSVHEMAH